jgi:hypothetical protein
MTDEHALTGNPKTLSEAKDMLAHLAGMKAKAQSSGKASHPAILTPSGVSGGTIEGIEKRLAVEPDPKERYRLAAKLAELRQVSSPVASIETLESLLKAETDPCQRYRIAAQLFELRNQR